MKKLDIIISNPTDNDIGQTVTYESNDTAKILEALINNIVYFDISENIINANILSYLKKLQNKTTHRQYYDNNKAIIDILLNIEKVLAGLNQTYQDENNVDSFDDELYYIDTLEDVRDKLLFAVTKKIPELADDLLMFISSNYNNSIVYYDKASAVVFGK